MTDKSCIMIVYTRCWSQDIRKISGILSVSFLILCIKQHIFNLYILSNLRIVRGLKYGARMRKEDGAETFVMFNTDARQHWICMLNFSSFFSAKGQCNVNRDDKRNSYVILFQGLYTSLCPDKSGYFWNHILSYTKRPCVHTKPVNPITETTALQSG